MSESQPSDSLINNTPRQSLFDWLGGEPIATQRIRDLVERFYDIMDSDQKAQGIREMHTPDLTLAREKLFMFLVGWTGGAPLYVERYGHPRLRARHLPFAIDESARDQWMYCMISAMHQLEFDEALIRHFCSQLYGVADFMRNRA